MGVEGLAEVVVGAQAEAGDAVGIGPLGGGDEDGNRAAVAELLEDGLALHPGQHEVEDHEVRRLGVVRGEGRGAVTGLDDRVAVALQVEPEQGAELRLVLDDEDPRLGRPFLPGRAEFIGQMLSVRLFRSCEGAGFRGGCPGNECAPQCSRYGQERTRIGHWKSRIFAARLVRAAFRTARNGHWAAGMRDAKLADVNAW